MILAILSGVFMLLYAALSSADMVWLSANRIWLASNASAVGVVLSLLSVGAGTADIIHHPFALTSIVTVASNYAGVLFGSWGGSRISNKLTKKVALRRGVMRPVPRASGFYLWPPRIGGTRENYRITATGEDSVGRRSPEARTAPDPAGDARR